LLQFSCIEPACAYFPSENYLSASLQGVYFVVHLILVAAMPRCAVYAFL